MTDQTQDEPFPGLLSPFPAAADLPARAVGAVGSATAEAEPTWPVRRTNVLARVSLVAGLCGFSLVPLLGSIVAIITGHLALADGQGPDGEGASLARAGLWLGYLAIALLVMGVAAYMLIVFVRSSAR